MSLSLLTAGQSESGLYYYRKIISFIVYYSYLWYRGAG